MRRRPRLVAALVTVAAGLALATPAAAAVTDPVRGYVVVLADDVRDPDAATTELERGQRFTAGLRYGTALHGFSAMLSEVQVARLRADPTVAYVAADTELRGHAMTSLAPKETVPVGIRRIRAANATQAHAASTTGVAVLDTGLDLANADLTVAGGINCVTPGTSAQDDHGHGTHVGGTLAGRNSGTGVTGVAPGTRLYAVKVMNARNSGTLSQALCGIDWVAANAGTLGIRVANMSIGAAGTNDNDCGRTNNDPMHTAICRAAGAGVTFVVSAGNSAASVTGVIPAAYPEVLTVSGMTDTDGIPGRKGPAPCSKGDADDTAWRSSNYAASAAEAAHMVAAPAACIVSAKRGGGVATMSGTSMAAPHVAGAVALCVGNGGGAGPCASLTPAQTIARMRSDAAIAAADGFGFVGDLLAPITGKTLGNAVSAATY